MSAGKRQHRATGKPQGGARPGAGRPAGLIEPLPRNTIPAIKACKLRIPEKATPEEAELATRALQRVIDVMEEKVSAFSAGNILKAATHVRAEICGPVAQRHQVEGGITISVVDPYAKPQGDE